MDIELSDYNNPSLTPQQHRAILLRLGVISNDEFNNTIPINEIAMSKSTQYMVDKICDLDLAEAIIILKRAIIDHHGDVNFDHNTYDLIQRLVTMSEGGPDNETKHSNSTNAYLTILDHSLQAKIEAGLIAYHSPYPEIRAITDPFDDPNLPVDTLRVYIISLFWTFIGSVINNFFVHRLPSISLQSYTILLLLLPTGKLWHKYFPNNFTIRLGSQAYNLNPGPWNYKEMILSSIIYGCSSGTPYAIYNIFVMKLDKFYGLKWVTLTYQVLLTLSSQFLGFGFAGVMRKVCIYPVKAMWPTILPTIALNRALINHDQIDNNPIANGWRISQYLFFFVVFVASFVYNWIPSYLFKALSTFNWPTWFNPSLLLLANITGSNIGLGLNPLPSFDWNILNTAGCLTVPFYTYVNQYIGSLLAFVVILYLYYTNNKWTGYLPINTNELFNNKGQVYKVHEILNDKNQFDTARYKSVGPPYFSAANLVVYGAYFALYPFTILYQMLSEWQAMKASYKNVAETLRDSFTFQSSTVYGKFIKDPHCKMMLAYDEVPDWWFTVILVFSTLCGVICIWFYPIETPLWGIFFTIFINFIFLIPLTTIASTTGFSFGLNVLVELFVGWAIPNSGLALITLKCYGTNIDHQAANYITDQKLAHYAKIPPRAIFKGQILSTFLSVMVALVICNWQLNNVDDICDRHQANKLSCPGANTYFYSSVQYGVIGPSKVFSGVYPILKWCFLFGVVLVIPCLLFKYYGPRNITRYYNPTVILGGFLLYAPYNLLYYTGGLYLSYYFMYYLKNNYLPWWEKYNYVLTSGLSAGVAFSTLLIFFTVKIKGLELSWWGNSVFNNGIEGDNGSLSRLDVKDAPEGYFGLRQAAFP